VIFFSDDSDEPSCAVKHLPSRLLLSTATTGKRKKSAIGCKRKRLEADEVDETEGGSGETQGQWRRQNPGLLGTNIPAFRKPALPAEDQVPKKNLSTIF
jgi:hypothetical protein